MTEIGKNKIEGDYYVWDKDEIKDILQEDFDLFKEYFNLIKMDCGKKINMY